MDPRVKPGGDADCRIWTLSQSTTSGQYCMNSAIMNRDRRDLIPGVAIDKSQKRREQFALILGRRGANLGGDGVGVAAGERKRALELLVLPSGGPLALAPDPHVGSATAFADCGLFGDERAVELGPGARNDLDDFHEFPPACAYLFANIQRWQPVRPPAGHRDKGATNSAVVPPHSDGFVAAWAGAGTSLLRGFAAWREWPSFCRRRPRARKAGRSPLAGSRLPARQRFERSLTDAVSSSRTGARFALRALRCRSRLLPANPARRRRLALRLARRSNRSSPIERWSSIRTVRSATATAATSRSSPSSARVRGARSRTRCWPEVSRAFRRVSAIALAPRSFWRRNVRRGRPSLASGADRIMPSCRPTTRRSLLPSAAASPSRKARCGRSARAAARSTSISDGAGRRRSPLQYPNATSAPSPPPE